jgi:hypothetical protein
MEEVTISDERIIGPSSEHRYLLTDFATIIGVVNWWITCGHFEERTM